MKKLIGLCGLGISTQLIAAPFIAPELKELLADRNDDKITVIAQFKHPYSFFGINENEEPKAVQLRKMEATNVAQKAFMSEFEPILKSSRVEKLIPLWINNSVIVTADKDFIQTLTSRDDISHLIADEVVKLDRPILSEDQSIEPSKLTYGLKTVRAAEIWEKFGIRGSGVLVGILDTGYATHPDLDGRVIQARDFVSDYADNQPNDGQGHGTHCLGTIGGTDKSSIHIGVAPEVKFIVGKIFNDQGSTTTSAIMQAMQWIADPDGNPETDDAPTVVSNSWGGGQGSMEKEKPRWDIVTSWRELGIVPVFAAGNSGSGAATMNVPGGYPHAFAVGATDESDKIAYFSSRGPIKWENTSYIKPDISAPGVDIYSASHKNGGYTKMSGTSMATPHIAGIVALMRQADPHISVDRVEEILIETALDLGEPGKDNLFGFGRVDAYKAVELVLTGAKIEGLVTAGQQPIAATVTVNPGHKVFRTAANGVLKASLPAGEYELEFSAFSYLPQTKKIRLQAKETIRVNAELKKAPQYKTSFTVKTENNTLLDARIIFHDVPISAGQTNGQVYQTAIPGGKYTVTAQSRGYRSTKQEITVLANSKFEIMLKKLPPTLLVDDDADNNFETWYVKTLEALNADFDLVENTVAAEDAMGYQRIVWFTGSASSNILDEREINMLTEYIQNGGQLILSGQDIGYALKNTKFYKEVVGAVFLKDTAAVSTVNGQGLSLQLNGKDCANNQKYPDVIKANETAELIFTYGDGTGAATIHNYGAGTVVYLGFGFEGVNDTNNRQELMKTLKNLTTMSTKAFLVHLQNSFEKHPEAWHRSINNLENREIDKDAVLEFIETTSNTAPLQPVLQYLTIE